MLKEIDVVVDVFFVIYGGIGVKEEDYFELINNGICKFNVGMEFLVNWIKVVKGIFSEIEINKFFCYNVILVNEVVKEIVKYKIGLFMNLESLINLGNKWDEKVFYFFSW